MSPRKPTSCCRSWPSAASTRCVFLATHTDRRDQLQRLTFQFSPVPSLLSFRWYIWKKTVSHCVLFLANNKNLCLVMSSRPREELFNWALESKEMSTSQLDICSTNTVLISCHGECLYSSDLMQPICCCYIQPRFNRYISTMKKTTIKIPQINEHWININLALNVRNLSKALAEYTGPICDSWLVHSNILK